MQILEQQQDVINEYILKQKNDDFTGIILSLPMGYGKTLISLEICRLQNYRKVLIICSKTLVSSWNHEIKKIFNNALKYEIFHPNYISKKKIKNWKPMDNTQFIITTPEIIKKSYTADIDSIYVNDVPIPKDVYHFTHNLEYAFPHNPYGNNISGIEYFHSVKWDCVIIDECQNYTNIEAQTPKSICSLCSAHRILLSGTIFQEINLKRVMGLFLLLNLKFPRSTYECHSFITSSLFSGINKYCITRNSNPEFKNVILNTKIICHDLDDNEAMCFGLLKQIISELYSEYVNEKNKHIQNITLIRKLGGNLLAMIVYLRQTLVVPKLTINNLLIKILDSFDDMNVVKNMLVKIIEKYDLSNWINICYHNNTNIKKLSSMDITNNNPIVNVNDIHFNKGNSMDNYNKNEIICDINGTFFDTSTRIKNCMDILIKHENEISIVYSNFLICLNHLKNKYEEIYGKKNTFIITSEMTIKKRDELLHIFNRCTKGVLFLTYNMGAEGLNLQHAKNVIQLDMYWNRCKEDQAITRVFRNGQLSPDVNQYILISNTSLEKHILNKQCDKLALIKKLKTGNIKNFDVTKMKIKDIVTILKNETNYVLANTIKNFNLN